MKVIGITGGVGAGKSEILSYIRERYNCRILLADEAAHKVKEKGQPCTLVNARFVKPLDTDMIDRLCKTHKLIVTMEENVLRGGMGMYVTKYIHEKHPEIRVIQIALPDAYVEHGNVSVLREMLGINSDSVIRRIEKEFLNEKR